MPGEEQEKNVENPWLSARGNVGLTSGTGGEGVVSRGESLGYNEHESVDHPQKENRRGGK